MSINAAAASINKWQVVVRIRTLIWMELEGTDALMNALMNTLMNVLMNE